MLRRSPRVRIDRHCRSATLSVAGGRQGTVHPHRPDDYERPAFSDRGSQRMADAPLRGETRIHGMRSPRPEAMFTGRRRGQLTTQPPRDGLDTSPRTSRSATESVARSARSSAAMSPRTPRHRPTADWSCAKRRWISSSQSATRAVDLHHVGGQRGADGVEVVAERGSRQGLPSVVAGQPQDALAQPVELQVLIEREVDSGHLRELTTGGRATSMTSNAEKSAGSVAARAARPPGRRRRCSGRP